MDGVGHVGGRLGAPFEGAAAEFLSEIEQSGALPVGVDAQEAASAVVCALLARLDLQQGREVLDALPPAVREAVGRCPIHEGDPALALRKEGFLAGIGQHFELEPEGVEGMTAAVLQSLHAQLPPRPAAVIARELPSELRDLLQRRI